VDRVTRPRVSAILAAGGIGARVGAERPKQFLDLGGRSMLELSLAALATHPEIDDVVVALPAEHLEPPAECLGARWRCPVRAVAGGARRQESVSNAFGLVDPSTDVVLVHDAARPFVASTLVSRVIDAAAASGAAVPAVVATDTVKRARMDGGLRWVVETVPRQEVFLAQTPQGFRYEVLAEALASSHSGATATDEASMVERLGRPVALVDGDHVNVKITTPDDLVAARERSRASGAEVTMRIGTGYDLHRLVAGRPLVLAGLRVPFELGLEGHSDADIVCHAVTDAVLGAAALGDIGQLFPDTSAEWKDADSVALLRLAMTRVAEAGCRVGNVDVTVIAQRPKLSPHVPAMRANLAAALGVDMAVVSIKGKTNEEVDSMGRGESMACHAVVLLVVESRR
jgi:2-C-methyl-D-erythritol 4-phosphate cytidylyltransferase / 2-C-methyl-D-erythritol 2,4-cyclodiphosphate synthase